LWRLAGNNDGLGVTKVRKNCWSAPSFDVRIAVLGKIHGACMIWRLSAMFIPVLLSAAASAAPAPRQPADKWVVSFADDQCFAIRNYGTDSNPIYLTFKAPAIGDVMQLGVMKKGKLGPPAQTAGYISFDAQPQVAATLFEFDDSKLGQHVVLTNVTLVNLAPIRQARTMRIKARDDGTREPGSWLNNGALLTDESFSLGQMDALLNALKDCTDNLRTVFRVAKDAEHPLLRREPDGNFLEIFNGDDYPDVALSKDQTGQVRFVLLLDEKGKVVDCTVVQTSGVASLDAQTCALINLRGRFQPAIGLDGKPSKSAISRVVNWMLEY